MAEIATKETNVTEVYRTSFKHYSELHREGRIEEEEYFDIVLHITAMYMASKVDLKMEQIKKMLEILE